MTRVALIIGQTDHLCEAICAKLAALQYRVLAMLDADVQRQSEWLALMRDGSRDLQTCFSDIENGDDGAHRIAEFEKEAGSIDVLVLARSKNDYSESLFATTRRIGKEMSVRDYGRIVVIDFSRCEEAQENESRISLGSRTVSTQDFAKTLAAEIADKNVTINIVTEERIGKNSAPTTNEMREVGSESKPANEHFSQQQEIAGLVAYLVSDEATFISGANIAVHSGSYLR